MTDCPRCGHSWDWHGPGKDCMCGGCMWFVSNVPHERVEELRRIVASVTKPTEYTQEDQ